MADPYASIATDPYASIATSTPPPGKSLLQKAGDAVSAGVRDVNYARTQAARDPVGALFGITGAIQGGLAGFREGYNDRVAQAKAAKQPIPRDNPIEAIKDAYRGATDLTARDRYNNELMGDILGPARIQGDSMPARIGRGAEDLAVLSAIDPISHGSGAVVKGTMNLVKPLAGAVSRIPAVSKWAGDAQAVLHDPALQQAVGKVAHGAQTLTAPLRGFVNAGKDILFQNPLVHGVGNLATNSWLTNGFPTAARGLWYGIRGAPERTTKYLENIHAGAYTPELMGNPSPFGPVGWMSALKKAGTPAVVRGVGGGAIGAGIGNETAPANLTPADRAKRDIEAGLIGAWLGVSPEIGQASNKVMSRLEAGQRASMFEHLPKPKLRPGETDPRGAALNAIFGGGKLSPWAKIATAMGGPFAGWQGDVVPRVVGGAMVNAPGRVGAVARGQDIANRDILKDKQYKLQIGGPIGDAAQLAFNPQKYASRMVGPLGALFNSGDATNPDALSPGASALYEATPGRSLVGPFFGDTMYPSKAPAIPSAALSALVGWHIANKTPRQDAILSIMRQSGLSAKEAAYMLDHRPRYGSRP